ncbi:hypothetical protein [Mucisphaera calidilacus]|uniref:Uncharacterized protein n=1 Tax=Mucisphaera calidilacus TaxID=2527982 RepID=A0A518BTP1_9BACT|nr:hypothetical protein [Mucisphaera calidilacus]QDU70327.1 hypothetical protein Pan265_01500 [Mucisphaera calidilacus]
MTRTPSDFRRLPILTLLCLALIHPATLANPFFSEYIPAHNSRSASWPAMLEIDNLQHANGYQVLILDASPERDRHGYILAQTTITPDHAATALLISQTPASNLKIGSASLNPLAQPLLTPGLDTNLPFTALLLDADTPLNPYLQLTPELLALPQYATRILDAITLAPAPTTSLTPLVDSPTLATSPGQITLRTWTPDRTALDDWQTFNISAHIQTPNGTITPTPGRSNPVPHDTNPEPSTAALTLLAVALFPRRGRIERDKS